MAGALTADLELKLYGHISAEKVMNDIDDGEFDEGQNHGD
jgi:hypothetical protein